MEDTERLIYNELLNLRKDFREYRESMDKRVTALEQFKNKLLGISIVVGVAAKCVWDIIMERVV